MWWFGYTLHTSTFHISSPGRGIIFYAEVESFASFAVLLFLRWADAFKCILESIYGGTLHLSTTAFWEWIWWQNTRGIRRRRFRLTIYFSSLPRLPHRHPPPTLYPAYFVVVLFCRSMFLKRFNEKSVLPCIFDAWGKRFAILAISFFHPFTLSLFALLFPLSSVLLSNVPLKGPLQSRRNRFANNTSTPCSLTSIFACMQTKPLGRWVTDTVGHWFPQTISFDPSQPAGETNPQIVEWSNDTVRRMEIYDLRFVICDGFARLHPRHTLLPHRKTRVHNKFKSSSGALLWYSLPSAFAAIKNNDVYVPACVCNAVCLASIPHALKPPPSSPPPPPLPTRLSLPPLPRHTTPSYANCESSTICHNPHRKPPHHSLSSMINLCSGAHMIR